MSLSHEISRRDHPLVARMKTGNTLQSVNDHISGGDDDHTNGKTANTGMPTAYTCSTSYLQKGRCLSEGRAYENEKRKSYLIVIG